MDVPLTTTTLLAAVPPILTLAPDTNPVPVMLTAVPPAVGPEVGEIELTVGAGLVEPRPLARPAICMTQAPPEVGAGLPVLTS